MKKIKENKSQRFHRLVEKRVSRLFHQLRVIGNLSNKVNYIYTPKEANKMFHAIEKEVAIIKALYFTNVIPPIFTLDDRPKPVKIGLETPLERLILPVKKIIFEPKKEEVKIDRCNNCFENRLVTKYLSMFLCKRCYRKRKVIRKIKAHNGDKKSLVL